MVEVGGWHRRGMIKAIRAHGFTCEILEANNGEEAMNVLSKDHEVIGLILLDWQMPKMDGMEFMRGVIKVPQTASIPIVMVTASGSEEAQSSVRRVNPKLAGYVVKPYEAEQLINGISPFLKNITENIKN